MVNIPSKSYEIQQYSGLWKKGSETDIYHIT
jgi:hypothetical protein